MRRIGSLVAFPRTIAAVAVVVALLGIGTASSSALWSSQVSASAQVSAASVSISSTQAATTSLATSAMFRGTTTTSSFTVANTGAVPLRAQAVLAMTGGSAVIGAQISVTMWRAASCATVPTTGTTTGTLSAGATLPAGVVLQSGASENVCVRTVLSATAPNAVRGLSVTDSLTFSAVSSVSTTWTATLAPTAFSQAASTVQNAPVGSVTCTNETTRVFFIFTRQTGNVILSWSSAGAGAVYNVYDMRDGSLIAAETTATSLTFALTTANTNAFPIEVRVAPSATGWESTGVARNVERYNSTTTLECA